MEAGNTADLLGEPLLAPSTPVRNPQSENPTPLRYFLNDDSEEGDNDTAATVDHEKRVQLVALRILGKPFAKSFWLRDWPVAALLGAALSLSTLAFFATLKGCLRLWFPWDDAPVGMWWWLIVTSLGGLGCGILLLHPRAPNVGAVRTMFHDASDLKVPHHESRMLSRNVHG
jgi:hypothetical protein